MSYSLREVRAYLRAIERLEREQRATSVELGALAAQGSPKEVARLARKIRGRR